MRPSHGPAHNRARVAHDRAYLFWQSSVFTNRLFNLRIFAAVISFARCVSHHHWKQCFDNDCSCDTFKCTNSACFGAESTRSRAAILIIIIIMGRMSIERVDSAPKQAEFVHLNVSQEQSLSKYCFQWWWDTHRATWPVVCCAMLGCVQFGSVVWRVTRAIINIRTSMDRKQNSEFI